MSNLKKFTRVVDSFIQMVIRLCPDETAIKLAYEKFKMVTAISPMMAWQLFYTKVVPMRSIIEERDEKFFLETEIKKERLQETVANEIGSDNAFSTILNIKEAWLNKLSAEEKERIWQALGVMLVLSDAILLEQLKN